MVFVDFSSRKALNNLKSVAFQFDECEINSQGTRPRVRFDSESGIAMGHTRLSVLDLSPAGNQPMVSHSGRYVLSFNGEIYNHLDLRTELEQSSTLSWRGHSDTETLLASIEHWGVKKALVKSEGMFAFALWDANIRTLTLARDRMGEKPMRLAKNIFIFGSELKALREHPSRARTGS